MQVGDVCPLCRIGAITKRGQVMARDAYVYECALCGQYVLDPFSTVSVAQLRPEEALRLAYAVHARWDNGRGSPLFLDVDRLPMQIAAAPSSRDALEIADAVLLDLGSPDRAFGSLVVLAEGAFLAYRARSPMEVYAIVNALQHRGLIRLVGNEGPLQLTLDGYERVRELRVAGAESLQVFVAMSFADEMLPAYLQGIKPAVEAIQPLVPVRVDQGAIGEHNERIDDRIIREIQRSRVLIADVTHHRAGVYFEAGLAMGLGLPVVWCCRKDHLPGCHFDTRQYNHIVWETPVELREKLENRLATTLAAERRHARVPRLGE